MQIIHSIQRYYDTYKKNILQIGGLTIGYILFHKAVLLVFALVLFLLLLALPAQAVRVTARIDSVLQFIGNAIKMTLLALTFVLLLVPLSLMMKLFAKKETGAPSDSYFILRDVPVTAQDFEKMW